MNLIQNLNCDAVYEDLSKSAKLIKEKKQFLDQL
jgi:hypothetical protein